LWRLAWGSADGDAGGKHVVGGMVGAAGALGQDVRLWVVLVTGLSQTGAVRHKLDRGEPEGRR
jgi:hypothetical protein